MRTVTFNVRATINQWDFDDYTITLRIEDEDLKEIRDELADTCWPLTLDSNAGKALNEKLKATVRLGGYKGISSWKIAGVKQPYAPREPYPFKDGDQKTLREWFEILKPMKAPNNNRFRFEGKHERHGFVDIWKKNGYGLTHDEVEQHLDCMFFVSNIDIQDFKLREVYWK